MSMICRSRRVSVWGTAFGMCYLYRRSATFIAPRATLGKLILCACSPAVFCHCSTALNVCNLEQVQEFEFGILPLSKNQTLLQTGVTRVNEERRRQIHKVLHDVLEPVSYTHLR